ncbi:33 kDa ribonucleoprotein, chloroplastic [Argentina anserina]|uniref:33 kDa ribonucleoprotein, chloroplastic n=1 Tax=Argentina anserina TaxID=57926 RepID=UPI0021763B9F|nr:33 kDa ribonucleoprotein, chloroplastic [Potentilla anserina]
MSMSLILVQVVPQTLFLIILFSFFLTNPSIFCPAMSTASLSMASTSTTCSSSLCNKISNFSITRSLTQVPTHLQPQFKPLKLKAHFSVCSRLSSLHHFRRPFSALDGVEVEVEEEGNECSEGEEEKDPQAEMLIEEGEEEAKGEEGSDRSDAGRLYVGNLPYSMTSTQLSEIFGEAGTVTYSEIIYDRVTDRSRGFGFVTLANVEEAQEAIRMFDGSQVGGRTVRVNFPEVPRGGEREILGPKIRNTGYKVYIDSPNKIYAGNLGWGLTSQGLKDAFEGRPGLLGAKVIYERGSGRSRGFGFVTFDTAANAEAAVTAMNGVEVDGRELRLNMASERARTVTVTPPPAAETSKENTEAGELVSPSASEPSADDTTDNVEVVSSPASDTTEDTDNSELVSSVSI